MQEALALIDRLDGLASEEIKADLALGRAIVSKEKEDNDVAATFARAAITGYRRRLASMPGRADRDGDADLIDISNDVSNDLASAYGLLGFALLASG